MQPQNIFNCHKKHPVLLLCKNDLHNIYDTPQRTSETTLQRTAQKRIVRHNAKEIIHSIIYPIDSKDISKHIFIRDSRTKASLKHEKLNQTFNLLLWGWRNQHFFLKKALFKCYVHCRSLLNAYRTPRKKNVNESHIETVAVQIKHEKYDINNS